jgi:uncharacterized protein YceK
MKKLIIPIICTLLLIGCSSFPEGTAANRRSFSGTYKNADQYWHTLKKALEKGYAKDKDIVFLVFSKENSAAESDMYISMYERLTANVVKIKNNQTGDVIYICYSDIPYEDDRLLNAVPEAKLMATGFQTKGNAYGLTDESFKVLKQIFPNIEWDN